MPINKINTIDLTMAQAEPINVKFQNIDLKIIISAIELIDEQIENLEYDDGSDLIEINSKEYYDVCRYEHIDKLKQKLHFALNPTDKS